MKALIIRPREGNQPTFQLVTFPGHNFNEEFGDLYKVLDSTYLTCIKLPHITVFLDEEVEGKGYASWWCTLLRMNIRGPIAILSNEVTDEVASFDNEEVLHTCRECGMEEWPAA